MKKYLLILNAIVLSLFAMFLCGCGENYENFSLRFSAPGIELGLNEEQQYDIIIDNYFETQINFNFDQDKTILSIKQDKIENLGNGRFRIVVQGLASGSTNLEITLLQGNKKLTVPVKVYEPISSFTLKQNKELYVLRGESITFTSDLFNFNPETTLQQDLIYSAYGQVLQDNTFVADESTENSVVITATSAFNNALSTTFELTVLDKIDLANTYLSLDNEVIPTYEANPDYYIQLITNHADLYTRTLALTVESAYNYQVLTKNKAVTIIDTYTSSNYENTLFIEIQQNNNSNLNSDFLIIRASHKNFDAYYVDQEYRVEIVSMPLSLKINGSSNPIEVDLFDNLYDTNIQRANISIDPLNAKYETITINFSVIKTNPYTLAETETQVDYELIKEFLCVRYKGEEITDSTQLDDLSLPIEYFGRKVLNSELGDKIKVEFICESSLLDSTVSNSLEIVIHKSATNFYVNSEYTNSTIYVMLGDVVTFDGFVVVESDAYIGKISAIADYLNTGIVEVNQTQNNVASIEIKALKVGEANYTLVLSSGISTSLKIVVKDILQVNNFMIYPTGSSEDIAQVTYKDVGFVETLETIALRGPSEFGLKYNIYPQSVDNDMYKITLESEDINKVEIRNNIVRALVADDIQYTITVTLSTKKIEDFKLVDDITDNIDYSFSLICFNPIATFGLVAQNSGILNGTYASQVDVYDVNYVGYVDKQMSEVDLKIFIDGVERELTNLSDITWDFSISYEWQQEEQRYVLTESGSITYGYFYPNQLKFVCDGINNPSGWFKIYAHMNEYGKILTSSVQITIQNYVQVDSVWLSNYTNEIYLDAIRSEVTLYPYIMPINATNKNFRVEFQPDPDTELNVVILDYNTEKITISYGGIGGGNGMLHIIPISRIENENNEYSVSLDIPVKIGDGSISNPMHISTLDEFLEIDLANYYIIDTIIDANGKEIIPLGELTGGISGLSSADDDYQNVGGIINFRITKSKIYDDDLYYGLFTKISENAYLSNLTFMGSIDVQNDDNTNYIGLLCGENYGLIKNVNITLLNSNIDLSGDYINYIGGICGKNYGRIINDLDYRYLGNTVNDIESEKNINGELFDKNYQEFNESYIINENYISYPNNLTMFVYMPEQETLNLNLSNGNRENYFGGLVGYNDGLIKFRHDEENYLKYNYYGTSALINLKSTIGDNTNINNVSYLGGAVGYNNLGNVVNLLICGKIEGLTNVGGLVGYVKDGKILNNTSRVFVKANDYVSGLIGVVENGQISNNKVQAVDDKTKLGLDASLIVVNNGSNYDELFISNNVGKQNNVAQTYFTRNKIDYGAPININNYYGDLVKIVIQNSGIEYQAEVFNEKGSVVTLENSFNNEAYPDKTIVLNYYKAVNLNEQSQIEYLNKQFLPDDLFTNDNIEINITSKATSIITISNSGQLLLSSTGRVELVLTNNLNYDDKITIIAIVTNYVSGLELYTTSDRFNSALSQDSVIGLTNRNIVTLYPKFSSVLNVGHTIINLVENQQASLEIEGNDYVNISMSGNTIMLVGNGTINSTDIEKINFYIYIDVQQGEYKNRYLQKVGNEYKFISKTKSDSNFVANMTYSQGIFDIQLDKTNMTVVPSDIINVRVYYLTDDVNDELSLVLQYENKEFVDYNFNKSIFERYFKVEATSPKLDEFGRYYVDYTFEMNTNENVRLGKYKFVFSGSDGMVTKSLDVEFVAQPVNNVMIKNYTFVDNKNIVLAPTEDESGYVIYNTSYAMQESDTVTAGEVNILRIVVMPNFANYSYVEVTNANSNITNNKVVLFGLLKPFSQNNKDRSVISTESYFTSQGIRILKSAVPSGDITILYRLTTDVLEGDNITLDINFYDENGEIVYSQQQKILTIAIAKSIDISIANKDAKDSNNTTKSYYVARGYTYVLNVSSVGYREDEIVISTSSSYGRVYKDGGTYFLEISQNISYLENQEGVNFTLTYYGKRVVDGQTVTSEQKFIICTIVEYVLDSLDITKLFENNQININMGDSCDIRDYITRNLEIEYTSNAQNAVNELRRSLKENGTFYYRLSGSFEFLTAQTEVKNNDKVTIDKNFIVTPKMVGTDMYYFGLSAELYYIGGYIRVVEQELPEDINEEKIKEFNVSVNQKTSEEDPYPIYTYEDLTNIGENYYILMSDITIPSGFMPIDANFKKFDGNGYKIIFNGIYSDYENIQKFGLFDTVYEDSIVANLTIEIQGLGNAIFNFNNYAQAQSFYFGLLCAENRGSITNCSISMASSSNAIKITNSAPISITSTSYASALVAINNGFITNCRVEAKIESNGTNLAGLVAINNKHVSACYIKNSLIKNSSTNVNNSTGGIVVLNYGNIYASYIEGVYDEGLIHMYADNQSYIVQASSIAGAFVYTNYGSISDSYANIPVVSSSRNSGFVGVNLGVIKNCYTTSKLGDGDTQNYPFFIEQGDLQNCYFLKDSNFNVNVNLSNDSIDKDKLRPTSIVEFALRHEVGSDNTIGNTIFDSFIYNRNSNSSGVWFYPKSEIMFNNDSLENIFENLTGKKTTDIKNYNDTVSYAKWVKNQDFVYMQSVQSFVSNRPQLVMPNTFAYSKQRLKEQIYNSDTGETKFVYEDDTGYATKGSTYNPILVSSAEQFENDVKSYTIDSINSANFRFINDIDYNKEKIVVSSLYKSIMAGFIEGNFMTISGFSINTNETLLNSGYFAQIGDGQNFATLQNLSFAPKYINLPNAYNVGTVAGTINRAYIYNINVDGYTYNNNSDPSQQSGSGIVILGRDIVGGIFGRSISSFEISNLTSSVSVNAYLTNNNSDWNLDLVQNQILYEEYGGNNSLVAYSGSIMGYVGGSGVINNVSLTDQVSSIGMVSGFMFGGIGLNAVVKNSSLDIQVGDQNFVRASAYGGYFVGDLKGTIDNIQITGNSELKDLFKLQPRVPVAVGSVAGIVRQGKIYNTNSYIGVSFSTSQKVGYVGGFAGKVINNIEIKNSTFNGNILEAKQSLGGLIGQYYVQDGDANILIDSVNVGSSDASISLNLVKTSNDNSIFDIYIGGIIGEFKSKIDYDSEEDNQDFTFNNVKTYVDIASNVTMFGSMTTISPTNLKSIYSVWVGGFIGGFSYDNGSDEIINLAENVVENISIDENSSIDITSNLRLINLRNGMSVNSIPYEYTIYVSKCVYGLNKNAEKFDLAINNNSYSFDDDQYFGTLDHSSNQVK